VKRNPTSPEIGSTQSTKCKVAEGRIIPFFFDPHLPIRKRIFVLCALVTPVMRKPLFPEISGIPRNIGINFLIFFLN
jgi:hypothetical protein